MQFPWHAPQLKHFDFYYSFYYGYEIEKLAAPFTVLDTFREENPGQEKAYQLLRKICLHYNQLSNFDFVLSMLRSTEDISELAQVLNSFFQNHPDLLDQNKKLSKYGSQIISLIQQLTVFETKRAAFTEFVRTTSLEEEMQSFVCELISSIVVCGKELDWHEVFKTEEKYKKGSSINFNRIAEALDNQAAKTSLDGIFANLHSLFISSLYNREKTLPHMKNIRQLVNTFRENEWLTDQKSLKFVKKTLKALIRADNDEERGKALEHRIKMSGTDSVDLQKIKRAFQKEEVKALLTSDKLKEAVEFLDKNLRAPASSSSTRPDESCAIS